jgi:hypothetical protein
MKLTIQNIERLSGLGDFNSPYIVTNPIVHDDRYEILMQYEGRSWNVILYRDINPVYNQYRMLVQCIGKMHFETTAIDRNELSSAELTLSIIENLMDSAIKKVKA